MAKLIQGEGAEADSTQSPSGSGPSIPPAPSVTAPSLGGDSTKMKEDADKIIIDYYRDNATLFAGGNIPPERLGDVIAAVPRLARIQSIVHDGKKLIYELVSNPPLEDVQKYLVQVFGDTVKDLDFFSDSAFLSDQRRMARLLPEYAQACSAFSRQYWNAPPFILALAMDPPLRDLPILAWARIGTTDLTNTLSSSFDPLYFLQGAATPPVRVVGEVAKEYGIKNILPVLEALAQARTDVLRGWGIN